MYKVKSHRLGSALQCYKCKATSESSCEYEQKPVNCPPTEGRCMTLSYQMQYDNEVKYSYKKQCVKNDIQCNRQCKSVPSNVRNCKVRTISKELHKLMILHK